MFLDAITPALNIPPSLIRTDPHHGQDCTLPETESTRGCRDASLWGFICMCDEEEMKPCLVMFYCTEPPQRHTFPQTLLSMCFDYGHKVCPRTSGYLQKMGANKLVLSDASIHAIKIQTLDYLLRTKEKWTTMCVSFSVCLSVFLCLSVCLSFSVWLSDHWTQREGRTK